MYVYEKSTKMNNLQTNSSVKLKSNFCQLLKSRRIFFKVGDSYLFGRKSRSGSPDDSAVGRISSWKDIIKNHNPVKSI